jgi:hypothetical protein
MSYFPQKTTGGPCSAFSSRGMLLRLSGQGWVVARVKIAAGA